MLATHNVNSKLMEFLQTRTINSPGELLDAISAFPIKGRRPYSYAMFYWKALGKKVPPPHPLNQPLRVSNKTGGDEKGRSSRAAWAGGGRGLDKAAMTQQNETMGAAAATSLLL